MNIRNIVDREGKLLCRIHSVDSYAKKLFIIAHGRFDPNSCPLYVTPKIKTTWHFFVPHGYRFAYYLWNCVSLGMASGVAEIYTHGYLVYNYSMKAESSREPGILEKFFKDIARSVSDFTSLVFTGMDLLKFDENAEVVSISKLMEVLKDNNQDRYSNYYFLICRSEQSSTLAKTFSSSVRALIHI